MAGKPLVTIGGVPVWTNPEEIRWNFKMKTNDHKCMGGKVIQVYGTHLSDITLRGHFGSGDRAKGEREGWESQLRFRSQVEKWADQAVNAKNPKPIVFTYAPRRWRFNVFMKSISPVHMETNAINPAWELVLFPLEDGARDVIRGIKDLYIQRLMDGVGWKQTKYNGPTQSEVDDLLSPYGGSAEEFLESSRAQAFVEGAGG